MDETIRIYNPKANYLVASLPKRSYAVEEKPVPRYEKESWKKTIKRVFDEQRKQEKELNEKYPMIIVFYNWFVVAVIIALFISFIAWGIDIRTDRKAAALTATAMADYQAEQQAVEDARQAEIAAAAASETTIMKNEANFIAKMLYGARFFEDKYGYSTDDYMTLARCVFNRVDNPKFPNTVQEVVQQENQWVGYYDNNEITDKFYKIAYAAVEEWHHEAIRPVTSDYAWAELTSRGCYLKNDYEANGYAIRWRYGQ